MSINQIVKTLSDRIRFGCDIEDYSYLNNGCIQWSNSQRKRINLLISTIDKSRMYGGLSTAFKFYETLIESCEEFDARIIVTTIPVNSNTAACYSGYEIVESGEGNSRHQIYDYTVRNNKRPALTVREDDIFLCTFWTTMYLVDEIRNEQKKYFGNNNPIIYLIQDYEPGFYKWSSEYLLAESTYRIDNTIAVINSENLMDYFNMLQYDFYKTYCFTPKLNSGLKKVLLEMRDIERKERIIVYGRPFNGRNCFSLIVAALNKALEEYNALKDWEIWSIGAKHKDIHLERGNTLICKGKLSIDEYGKILLESRVGISMMCSPHPSYPPLEMATFGVNTITNSFLAKELSQFSDNVTSVQSPTINNLSQAIIKNCQIPSGKIDYQSNYVDDNNQFTNIIDGIKEII